ncbi:COG2958 family protein [Commensalibacter papalotli (ex Servin-Garciduenas et al. 2014)]|uniref:HrgA protein n=1 Tax=Commensalibacter papalotli (ex Servin-Garciduenas et al. 2014) TaxID=1208583 RepID=W7DZ97_9PROT|nr:HrgA protein [Commensalibacter papalotli (ex Servin-Garciduenas et al. 2014)]EUK18029.1 hypothetical protein COMX_08550 [Commensalibacter papalotli (ex Servin-Garciduenas et al. 2014)]
MENSSQVRKIVTFLKSHPNQRFTAREIAEALIAQYPEFYTLKRQNSRQKFVTDAAFVNQIVAEIGSRATTMLSKYPVIEIQNQPRPRKYWFSFGLTDVEFTLPEQDVEEQEEELQSKTVILSEKEMYSLLCQYLEQMGLITKRLDEKRSKNSKGKHANKWLHPDIVAMQPIPDQWDYFVQSCVQAGGGDMLHLWAFEVKKTITMSTIRADFFQSVSNSSWANYGYLVCAAIEGKDTEEELRMLCSLHGIGVINLITENPSESSILIPAHFKEKPDWRSINRLVQENKDMEDFIKHVANYYRSGLLIK